MVVRAFARNVFVEAARRGALSTVMALWTDSFVTEIDCRDDAGWTALLIAASAGHAEIAKFLLEQGASIESRSFQSLTPLHLAVATGNVDMVQLLCRYKADVDAHGLLGATALHLAQEGKFTQVVSCLLAHGASVEAVDDKGDTAFIRACQQGDDTFVDQVVKKLDEAGASDAKRTLVNKLRDSCNATPLNVATYRGHFDLVVSLIHHGAELEIKNTSGYSPLNSAVAKGHEEVVQYLLESGADKESAEIDGNTPLLIASSARFGSIVDLLLENGAETDHKNENGFAALHVAALEGDAAIVESLLTRGASPEIQQNEGWTPLLHAAANGHVKVVELLLNKQEDINYQSDDNCTPLIVAVNNNHKAVCQLLLERGASTAHQRTDGQTVLHLAAATGIDALVELLMHKGAESTTRDFDGRSAAYVAATAGHFAIADRLNRAAGTSANAHDDNVWPEHSLRELYGLSTVGEQDTTVARRDPPWYIDRSSIASIAPYPRLVSSLAQFFVGTWRGSQVVIVDPNFEYAKRLGQFMGSMKQAFQRQVSKLYPLRHPHVIRLYGANHRDERPFLVMEHTQDDTLKSVVANKKQHTWKILHQVALGVQYLHERGIVHGNLTGENILIGDDNLIKLSAFGAYSTSDKALHPVVWMAPEVLTYGQKKFESDIYSLGMCIIEAVSQEAPYACEVSSGQDAQALITSGVPPSRPAAFSSRGWELVTKMICSQRRDRIKISDAVRELAALKQEEASNAVDTGSVDDSYDLEEAFAIALSLISTHDEHDRTPQIQVLRRLHDAWKDSQNLRPADHWLESNRVQGILSRFTKDLVESAREGGAASFAAERQRADRVFSFHNEIDSIVDRLNALTDSDVTATASNPSSWRECWLAHRRAQLQKFGASLKHVDELDVESSTCLLFELTRRRDAYTSIPPQAIHTACCTLRAKNGVRLPDWFIPHSEVSFDASESFSKGSFGSVHRGEWMGSRAVIKKMFADDGAEFEKEVELWSQLYHPHVLQLFGACHVGQKFIVSEFAELGQLDHYLRTQRRQELWRTLHEAALGLRYLHSRGIVHCDLKCNNILIGRDGKAKVSDYGLSQKQHDEVLPSTPQAKREVGAPRWKAPEVLNGAKPTVKSDIYGFGMCVVEAVTGNVPWISTADDGNVRSHVRNGGGLFDKPGGFTDAQWALVVGACQSDPKKRLSLSEIVVQLQNFAVEAREGGDDTTMGECNRVDKREPGKMGSLREIPLSWDGPEHAAATEGQLTDGVHSSEYKESWD